MINIAHLNFQRVIMHEIFEKEVKQPHATVEPAKNIYTIDDTAKKILRDRLTTAAGKDSKAFELEIGNSSKGTFYDLATNLKGKTEKIFITQSTKIAHLLATCQTSSNMPGGYLLVIQAEDADDKSSALIVIKAELHEGFRSEKQNGKSVLKVLDDIFLSPSQKLYKIGVIYEKPKAKGTLPNELYGCFLFDDQFRKNTKPAEYFWKDFLGFDISKNAKIQSQLFYEQTYHFIESNFKNTKEKDDLMHELKNLFTINQEKIISPSEFSTTYFSDSSIQDKYANEVLINFPASIVKDSVLIDYELNHKKWNFPNKIKLSGPESDFNKAVTLIDNKELFESLNPEDNSYTILKISGQPFRNE